MSLAKNHKKIVPVVKAKGYKIIESTLLNDCVKKSSICGHCCNQDSNMILNENVFERCGLAESLFFQCDKCFHKTNFTTSKVVSDNYHKHRKPYDVNVRSVYASQSIGVGRAGLEKLCAAFDLPAPVSKTPYNVIMKNIVEKSCKLSEDLMNAAANRLIDIAIKEYPEYRHVQNDGTFLTEAAVTVDGTWQRRGHCSKIGVVFVISVVTGEVLDYDVKSMICHECVSHKNDDRLSQAFIDWYSVHKDYCFINHVGSSDSMETEGAITIFLRSIKTRNLKYTTFVGDGDSGCYGAVSKKCHEKYGDNYTVVKEECVGHVQKRMGSGLREFKRKKKGFKLSDNKTVGGRNRLTDKIIDKMQNYYGQAIRNNIGDLEGMKKSISAIFKHMIRKDNETLEEQHSDCPKEEGTWCKFWDDKLKNTDTYIDENRLPSAFICELKPLFNRLSCDVLLKRCLKGRTQNQNEAINGVLWSRCPKNKFCGSQRVKLAVSESVSAFNTGAGAKCNLLETVGVTPGPNMISAFRKEDHIRILNAENKVSLETRMGRRKRRAERKSTTDSHVTYFPGAFGLSNEPEIDFGVSAANKKKRKVAKLTKPRKENGVRVQFIDDKDVLLFFSSTSL